MLVYKVIILCMLIIEKSKMYKYNDRSLSVEERVVYSLRQEICKVIVVKRICSHIM